MTRLVGEHFKADGKPKRGFLTEDAAKRWVKAHPEMKVTIYPCTFCKKWHLASEE